MRNNIGFAYLRIVFGLIWLIDAYFKWQSSFLQNFVSYVTGGLGGQPVFVQAWIHMWINIIGVNTYLFAITTAIIETVIALGLILGLFTRPVIYLGIALSLVIWSTAETFGGPYRAGSTDIGTAIIYVLVFVALLLGHSWEKLSFGTKLSNLKNHRI